MAECFYHRDEIKKLRKLRELKPELFKSFVEFDTKAFAAGELDGKMKHLIALGGAHITQCPYCIDTHVKAAKKAGATDGEIAETVFVAMAIRAGGSWAHGALAMAALEE
jgi:AhpD family alkylhydroperoxidase